ncbi:MULTISPECIES: FAD-dependent oxidoreductase [Hydrogenophaga]|uniref:Monooxygenase FAD-binding protein n=1 Tax=Hydrogenophaga intermedia TaxID=65786 RepID=A0A1L1PWB9_HYDIT|nr:MULTISPECIES: FAD-dependent oxidoreductase [Hydrogenophaga]AOS79320.1 monooxygenase [Hydrogenophaga sp. PBC]TMU72863.1 FAD-binding protein [Hydrogenophaga intermedia]CDN90296.1 Monooxygenase FAD-binding protein [Hydrogenophaga intermedia]
MHSLSTQVLIVGAGPAGLATAIGLAERGVDFVIVDALDEAQNTSRAAVIHAATLDSLRALSLSDRLVAQGIEVPRFRIRERDAVLFDASFAGLPTLTPFALMIPQDETERIFIDRLAELGHVVRRPVRLTRFDASAAGVRATCEGEDGAVTIDARYIVGADGEKSTVRAGAGIAFPGDTYGSFLLADVRMDWPIERQEVSLFFAQAGTVVVAPLSRERYRVVAQLADAPPAPALADVQRLMDARGPRSGVRVREVLWGSRFQVHHKLADRLHQGPVLLVGDAAHVHSPAGGQGMNLGLRDAVALSGALHAALRDGTENLLEAYGSERRLAAARVLAMTDRLTRVATLSGPAARWVRNRLIAAASAVPAVKRAVARRLAGYG